MQSFISFFISLAYMSMQRNDHFRGHSPSHCVLKLSSEVALWNSFVNNNKKKKKKVNIVWETLEAWEDSVYTNSQYNSSVIDSIEQDFTSPLSEGVKQSVVVRDWLKKRPTQTSLSAFLLKHCVWKHCALIANVPAPALLKADVS